MNRKEAEAIVELRKLVGRLVNDWEGESLDSLRIHLEELAESCPRGECPQPRRASAAKGARGVMGRRATGWKPR